MLEAELPGAVQIEVMAAPSSEDREVILDGLSSFNEIVTRAGRVPLVVLVRDANGATVGGLIGRTGAGWLAVETVWLPEGIRGSTLGTRVMAEAEGEAKRRGCHGVQLNTGSFQAPGFYRRLGYEVYGVLDDYPPGHQRLSMMKRLDREPAKTAPPHSA